ncbi:MAG: carboxypeptidase M32 [Olsenella sp.]|nr:carboxypeptidase M32 [Olsenella sp.]
MITLGDCDGDPSSKADGTVHSPLSQAAGQQRIPGTPVRPAPAALSNPRADIAALNDLERHLFAHRYAQIGISCYGSSIDPEAACADRGEAQAILEEEDKELLCSEGTGALLDRLSTMKDLLTETQIDQVKILRRDRARLVDVPAEVQGEFTRLTTEATDVWRRAKAANDWKNFEPYLDRIVEQMTKIADLRNPHADPYDVWLDDYERGTDRAFYNNFFNQVKDTVVPLLDAIRKKRVRIDRSVIEGRFDINRQWEVARDLMDLEGLDPRVMFLTHTEHPYSDALTTNYAIIAAHPIEDDVSSNVFTMLHEGGHALYECGVNPAFNYTSLKGGTSSGMHEAQSRFFENYVGRSRAFAPHIVSIMAKHFRGQLGRVTANQFYMATNKVEGSLIRTEADELTYPLHILIRYEIEQMLFAGQCRAADVPDIWNEKYKAYLGVSVPDYAHGALQDTHWACGDLGYFPTYALGSAYGAQLRHQMIAEGLDWEATLASGDLAPIREWLRNRIWRFGRSRDAGELIESACGEPFSPTYYTDYLSEKFSSLYNL